MVHTHLKSNLQRSDSRCFFFDFRILWSDRRFPKNRTSELIRWTLHNFCRIQNCNHSYQWGHIYLGNFLFASTLLRRTAKWQVVTAAPGRMYSRLRKRSLQLFRSSLSILGRIRPELTCHLYIRHGYVQSNAICATTELWTVQSVLQDAKSMKFFHLIHTHGLHTMCLM